MGDGTPVSLTLESLGTGIPVLLPEAVGFYKQNCMVCFDDQGHASGVSLPLLYGSQNRTFSICWTGEVTERMRAAYKDIIRATDNAACAIALLVIREVTEFTAIEQATRGTTVDYYLGSKDEPGDLIFNHKARLEASGILRENVSNTIEARIKEKKDRLKGGLPAYVVIVEFGGPVSKMVKL